MVGDELDCKAGCSAKASVKSLIEDTAAVVTEVSGSQNFKDLSGDISQCSVSPNIEAKREVDDDNSRGNSNHWSCSDDVSTQNKSYNHLSVVSKTNDLVSSSLQYGDQKAQDVERTSEVVDECLIDKTQEANDGPLFRLESDGSDGHVKVQKGISKLKPGSGFTKDQIKSEGTGSNSQVLSTQHKMGQCVGKSLSAPSDSVTSKSSASDNLKPADTQNSNLNRPRVISDNNIGSRKDNTTRDIDRVGERNDQWKKIVKEHSKSSVNSVSKVFHSSRISQATVSKRTISDLKDSVPSSSSKSSSLQNVSVTSPSGESEMLIQSQCALNSQNKASSSGSTIKGEKLNQSNSLSSNKVNHGSSVHPAVASNSTATLSDEEVLMEMLFCFN